MVAYPLEGVLVFSGRWVFHPEQAHGLQRFAQLARFDGCQAVVHVVQQMDFGADGFAHGFKQAGGVAQILFGAPVVFARQVAVGGFVHAVGTAHAINLVQAGHAALGANGQVAFFFVAQNFVHRFGGVAAVGVAVDHHPGAAAPAQQLVQRHVRHLGLDVPQRGVHGGNGAHGHRAASPVGAFVEVLPDVFDLLRVAPDQAGDDMVFQITNHRQFAAVERGITHAVHALVGLDLEGDEVAAGATNDDAGGGDFHGSDLFGRRKFMRWQ